MLRAVPALVVRAELTLCQTHHLVLRVDRALSPVPEPAAAHGVLQARLRQYNGVPLSVRNAQ